MHMKRSSRLSFDRRSIALFATLAVASGMAAAQFTIGPAPAKATAPATQQTGTFGKLDADGNGSISRKEAAAGGGFFARNFDALDTNRDGLLSRAEFERASK
jgi:hypothetical protein